MARSVREEPPRLIDVGQFIDDRVMKGGIDVTEFDDLYQTNDHGRQKDQQVDLRAGEPGRFVHPVPICCYWRPSLNSRIPSIPVTWRKDCSVEKLPSFSGPLSVKR